MALDFLRKLGMIALVAFIVVGLWWLASLKAQLESASSDLYSAPIVVQRLIHAIVPEQPTAMAPEPSDAAEQPPQPS